MERKALIEKRESERIRKEREREEDRQRLEEQRQTRAKMSWEFEFDLAWSAKNNNCWIFLTKVAQCIHLAWYPYDLNDLIKRCGSAQNNSVCYTV